MVAPNAVETDDDYVHVQFRDPDQFEDIRTPDWAKKPAHSVSEGSKVRMGKPDEDADDWTVQSVLIDDHVSEEKAQSQAQKIVDKIED